MSKTELSMLQYYSQIFDQRPTFPSYEEMEISCFHNTRLVNNPLSECYHIHYPYTNMEFKDYVFMANLGGGL